MRSRSIEYAPFTSKELASAREYTLKQNPAETYVVFVDAYISELKKDLKK
jgi:hypothetical protein